jgi:hypothetical protein
MKPYYKNFQSYKDDAIIFARGHIIIILTIDLY